MMQRRTKRGRIDWRAIVWNTCGYLLLGFCTILFSAACYMGKQSAAVQLLMFCTALLFVLPPHSRRR
jgi:uncharacterized membrane protein YfcA